MIAVLIVLTVANHGLEFAVHWWRGTPTLLFSVGVSVAFTVVSTSVNYFVMRRSLLTVGHGSQTLLEADASIDLRLFRGHRRAVGVVTPRRVPGSRRFRLSLR